MKASSGGTDADFPQDSPLVGATITVDHLVNVATIIEVQNRVAELTTDSDQPSKGWVKAPKLLGPVRWGHGRLWPRKAFADAVVRPLSANALAYLQRVLAS
jgi:hypothetical protein